MWHLIKTTSPSANVHWVKTTKVDVFLMTIKLSFIYPQFIDCIQKEAIELLIQGSQMTDILIIVLFRRYTIDWSLLSHLIQHKFSFTDSKSCRRHCWWTHHLAKHYRGLLVSKDKRRVSRVKIYLSRCLNLNMTDNCSVLIWGLQQQSALHPSVGQDLIRHALLSEFPSPSKTEDFKFSKSHTK